MTRLAFAKKLTAIMAVAGATISASTASADVVKQDDNGFFVAHQIEVTANADDVYAMLRAPAKWWSPEHSWTGDAENFYMDAQATGCFCELIPAPKEGGARGSVEHMRIIYAEPGKMLRLAGSLGPLQAEAVQGSMTISLKPGETGTIIRFEYVVGGYMRFPVERIAPAVDGVVGEQVIRLAKILGPVAEISQGQSGASDASDSGDTSEIEGDEADNKDGKSEGATRIIEGDAQSESVEG
jgi:hypothetical protein